MARAAASKRTSPSIEAVSLSRNALIEAIGTLDSSALVQTNYRRTKSRRRFAKGTGAETEAFALAIMAEPITRATLDGRWDDRNLARDGARFHQILRLAQFLEREH